MPGFVDELRNFLSEVQSNQEKAASAKKKAEANTEAGSIGGATSHPVKSVDDQTQDATEGARSSENSSDVKKQIPGGGADGAPTSPPDQAGQQFSTGVTSTATGEDPSNEDNYKGDKEDPGTSHPAKADDGEKYSSLSYSKLKTLTEKKANALVANLTAQLKQAQDNKGKPEAQPAKTAASAVVEPKTAAAVGYDQAVKAGEPANQEPTDFYKLAAEDVIRNALKSAVATGQYLTSFKSAIAKKAEEEASESEDSKSEKSESPKEEASESSSEAPPKSSGGGGDVGGETPPAAAGGPPGMGGAPPAGAGDPSVDELLAALAELGITPDQLLAAIEGGAVGGGAPPGGDPAAAGAPPGGDPMAAMGGAPPGGDPMAAMGGMPPGGDPMGGMGGEPKIAGKVNLKFMAKSAKDKAKAGKFKMSEAKTAQQRKLRDEIKSCIREIVA
jgi:hypothetical protein